jgi:Na+/phosphate symporter
MKKNFGAYLKWIWLGCGILSVILVLLPLEGEARELALNAVLVLNCLMFLLSLPCSLFAVPVVVAAAYYLDMPPASSAGLTVSAIFLFVIGLMQWFWIARFWSPTEPPLQRIGLLGEN